MVNKQDYLNAVTQNIEIVRGDTLAFDFILGGLKQLSAYRRFGAFFNIVEHYGDNILAQSSINNGISLDEYDAEKDTALYSVVLAPGKTKNLDTGRYFYELKIEDETNVVTLMRGSFTLLYNID